MSQPERTPLTNVTGEVAMEAIAAPAPASRAWYRFRPTLFLSVLSVFAFMGLWTASTELGWIAPIFLPSPAAVAAEGQKLIASGELWTAVLASSQRVFLGFALAGVVAVPLGILMGVWW